MNGPVVLLLAAGITVPVFLLLLRLDAWMTERAYQRRIGGDESARYADARAAVARAQAANHVRIGSRKDHTHD